MDAKAGSFQSETVDASHNDGRAFYQVSTLNALMMGNFDGVVSVGELKRHGSWGIGTYEGLDGEAVICDGHAYDAHADGTTCEYADDDHLAFATVADFTEAAGDFELDEADGIGAVKGALDERRRAYDDNDNAWVMVAMQGSFPRVRVRSCLKQQAKPYPTLPEVASAQREFTYANERGWVIGVWVPAYLNGINMPGWHIHFLSEDRKRGGHILDLSVARAEGMIESYARFVMDMPTNREFDKLDLERDLTSATASVEG